MQRALMPEAVAVMRAVQHVDLHVTHQPLPKPKEGLRLQRAKRGARQKRLQE